MTKFLLCFSLALIPLAAPGWSGPISGPELSTRSELKAGAKEQFQKLYKFMDSELKFVQGRFFGAHSTQFTLSGSMKDAATCVRMIRELGLWDLVVLTDELGKREHALLIRQSANTSLVVTINSGREDFQQEEFKALRGEVAAPVPAEKDAALNYLRALIMSSDKPDNLETKTRNLAKADFAAKRARILTFGQPRIAKSPDIDEESGLTLEAASGCIVSKVFVEAVDIYNTTMRGLAKQP